jgi:hypothetical protein
MLVAAVATIPNVGMVRTWIARVGWVAGDGFPVLTRHVAALLHHNWRVLPMVSVVAAMLLLLTGISVARLAPRMIER